MSFKKILIGLMLVGLLIPSLMANKGILYFVEIYDAYLIKPDGELNVEEFWIEESRIRSIYISSSTEEVKFKSKESEVTFRDAYLSASGTKNGEPVVIYFKDGEMVLSSLWKTFILTKMNERGDWKRAIYQRSSETSEFQLVLTQTPK